MCELGQGAWSQKAEEIVCYLCVSNPDYSWVNHHFTHTFFFFEAPSCILTGSLREEKHSVFFLLFSCFYYPCDKMQISSIWLFYWLYFLSHFILFNCYFCTWLTSSELLVCSWCSHRAQNSQSPPFNMVKFNYSVLEHSRVDLDFFLRREIPSPVLYVMLVWHQSLIKDGYRYQCSLCCLFPVVIMCIVVYQEQCEPSICASCRLIPPPLI